MANPTTSRITIRGCNIRLMRGGAGRTLVILHGAGGASWLPFMQKLTTRFEVIAPEHPGFGESDTPEWLDTIHDLAYFDLDLLEALDLERVHLVGLSLGGWVAAELAVRDTNRLASLTLVGAAGLHVNGVKQVDSFLRTDEQRIRDFFHDQTRADEAIAQLLAPEHADVAMKNRVTTAKLSWQPRGHDPHLHKWLHRIDVPTLLIWGAEDKLFPPEYAQAYCDLIPRSKVVVIPKCGHMPQVEQPEAFVAAIEDFIFA
jgi:pimeloyl-ACP methyl ester carboxylesterase